MATEEELAERQRKLAERDAQEQADLAKHLKRVQDQEEANRKARRDAGGS